MLTPSTFPFCACLLCRVLTFAEDNGLRDTVNVISLGRTED